MIARLIRCLFVILEGQTIDVPSSNRSSTAANKSLQYDQFMQIIYKMIKAMERRANKSAARVPTDTHILMKDFGVFWNLVLSAIMFDTNEPDDVAAPPAAQQATD